MSSEGEIQYLETKELQFDRSNPRLAEYGIEASTSQEEILKILWDAMDVMELVQSIASSGFFPHEAIIVAQEDSKYIVIEGNRRLAAVKVLLDPDLAKKNGWSIPEITAEARKKLELIPAILSGREDSWRFLGFKHVNGPAKWTSYAKAAYIAHVHNEYGVPLAQIAEQIGDRHKTVKRLYRGLTVLEQAERYGVYDREDRFQKRLAFSHLYTGLFYEHITDYLGISDSEDDDPDPVPESKKRELGKFLVWLYGSKKEKRPAVVQSQNPDLRRLNEVIGSKEALDALEAGIELSKAFEISRPPSELLQSALISAKRELTTASAYLSTGDDKTDALLKLSGTVAKMAADIYDRLDQNRRPPIEKRTFQTED